LIELGESILETQLKRRFGGVHHAAMTLGPVRIKLKPS
jgi:hypothetical protein